MSMPRSTPRCRSRPPCAGPAATSARCASTCTTSCSPGGASWQRKASSPSTSAWSRRSAAGSWRAPGRIGCSGSSCASSRRTCRIPGRSSATCRHCRARASARNGASVSARDEILQALRAAVPAEVPLPDIGRLTAICYPDLRERFAKSVVEVGGRCVFVDGPLEAALMELPEYASARKVVSLLPGVAKANVDLASVADPHQLHDVDFCVLPAVLGVAENGACWIVDHGEANRAAAFLTQHLAVIVRA